MVWARKHAIGSIVLMASILDLSMAFRHPAEAAAATPLAPAAGAWSDVGDWLSQKRDALADIIASVPGLPDTLIDAGARLSGMAADRSLLSIVAILAISITAGLIAELLFSLALRTIPRSATALEHATKALPIALAGAAVFLVVALSGIIIAKPGPDLRDLLIGVVGAGAVYRAIARVATTLLSPHEQMTATRVVPVSDARARLWTSRIPLLAGLVALSLCAVETIRQLGVTGPKLVAVNAGLMLLCAMAAIELVWRDHKIGLDSPSEDAAGVRGGDRSGTVWASVGIMAAWVLWLAGFYGIAWIVLMSLALPKLVRTIKSSFARFRVAEGASATFALVAGERLLIAALLLAAAIILMVVSKAGLAGVGDGGLFVRLVSGLSQTAVILLMADLSWHLTAAGLDVWLHRQLGSTGRDEARQARLRTLMSVFRNGLLIVVGLIALMMALAALGIDIGPLIAGAGVAGVALGFGAQTVVKDIISGVFYLFDDAFRVGEYIQSGSYKGTVESFTLRSVRLRHHRGSLYTVPFSSLGAVQNMSRDWVLEKIKVGVPYDTDLATVKQIVKAVGKELEQDGDIAPDIIETLKMQGVEEFTDYAMQIHIKIKTKPGDPQFLIKRQANALLKKAFDAHGIKFAVPTVQVAGDGGAASAAAAAVELSPRSAAA